MEKNVFVLNKPFYLESGQYLSSLTITYHTMGKLNKNRDNVVWICHALTANSDVEEWWKDMVGEKKCFDPNHHYIICANILGSCYGTTSPLSVNSETGRCYYHDYPSVTMRDIVRAHDLLCRHLSINRIHIVIGGSIGGFQALEWSIMQPGLFDNLVILASSAQTSPWAIALNETQRMAIETDISFRKETKNAGIEGMKVARSIALMSYRNYQTYLLTQEDTDSEKLSNYKACSYQRYQGEKLAERFNAFSYYVLTKALDSHNVGRKRKGVREALAQIKAHSTIIGVTTDNLFPVEEQKFIADNVVEADYFELDSKYGHDGFLLETTKITRILNQNIK
jgi:homoserine O-acetyltransferase